MDWTKVAANIGSTAPLLAGLVGGPVGLGATAAAAIISHALGTPSDPAFVEPALNDPGALEKIRQAESANSLQLQQLIMMAALSSLAHDSDMAGLATNEISNARSMGVANRDWVPKVLAMAVTTGFFGILLLMAFQPLPGTNKDLVNVIVGALGTAWIIIIGYFFGTLVGSMRKTDLLAKPGVPITPDSASTLREPAPQSGSPAPAAAAPAGDAFQQFAPGAQGPIFSGGS
ncbi:hypothetical protein [Paraburkholderia sp. HP33-1]|uniref:hypothetical protein n=1 Tax=Paraburkholderia sp. HP33-1 TaxID=2883243 RepID=UPI001F24BB13|nr:hypothetical protein [Paraburkholderia sp. HP33-1]